MDEKNEKKNKNNIDICIKVLGGGGYFDHKKKIKNVCLPNREAAKKVIFLIFLGNIIKNQ